MRRGYANEAERVSLHAQTAVGEPISHTRPADTAAARTTHTHTHTHAHTHTLTTMKSTSRQPFSLIVVTNYVPITIPHDRSHGLDTHTRTRTHTQHHNNNTT